MLENTKFNNWYYGTLLKALNTDKINIGVFNPAGIRSLLHDSRLEVLPIYVQAPDGTRLMRCLNREENPNCKEICRRYFADEEDFENLDFSYWIFENTEDSDFIEGIKSTADFIDVFFNEDIEPLGKVN